MLRLVTGLTCFFLLIWCYPAISSDQLDSATAPLKKYYEGSFRWNDSDTADRVFIELDHIGTSSNGRITAYGKGVYIFTDPDRLTSIEVKWVINPKSLRFEMWEMNAVGEQDFITNGSHVGTISADMDSITATWTTKGTGQQGTLQLDSTDLAHKISH